MIFHKRSNYDYDFIIRELAEEFVKKFNCLGENTEKCITFSVQIEKEVIRIDKSRKEVTKIIFYRLQFIDSTRFMASSLSNFVNNLAEGIHKIKCNYGHNDNKCETCPIKYRYYDCFLTCTNFKDVLIEHICLCCNDNYEKMFDEKLKERFLNTHKFSNHDNNKFILLFQKDAYPYEYMDDWKKFNSSIVIERAGRVFKTQKTFRKHKTI